MADPIPMYSSADGQAYMVPPDQVPDAIAAGHKPAVKILDKDSGTAHWVPMDLAPKALAAGHQLAGSSPSAPKVDMKEDKRSDAGILAKGTPASGVRQTLSRELGSLGASHPIDTAKGIAEGAYHAFSDPATRDESQGYQKWLYPDRVSRGFKRMMIEPAGNAASDYASTAAGKPVMGGHPITAEDALDVAPEAIGQGGQAAILGKAGDVVGDVAAGGEAEGMGMKPPSRASILAKGVGSNVPFTETPLSTVASNVGEAGANLLGKGVKAGASAATDAAGSVLKAGGKLAAQGAIKVGQGIAEAITPEEVKTATTNIVHAIEDALPNSSDPVKTVQGILADAGEVGRSILEKAEPIAQAITEQGSNAVKAVKGIVEQAVGEAHPEDIAPPARSVGSAAPSITPIDVEANDARSAPGMQPLRPDAMAPPEESNLPVPPTPDWRLTGEAQRPGANAIATASEEHPEVGRVATPGQLQGGIRQTIEDWLRGRPGVGKKVSTIDARQQQVMAKAVEDLHAQVTKSLNDEIAASQAKGESQIALQSLRDNLHRIVTKQQMKNGMFDYNALGKALDELNGSAKDRPEVQAWKRLAEAGQQMQRDWKLTSVKGVAPWVQGKTLTIAAGLAGVAVGGIGGAIVMGIAGAAGDALIDGLGKYMMTPEGAIAAPKLFHILSKVNPTPEEIKTANALADTMWKGIKSAQEGGKVKPETHQFSKSAWQKANPKATAAKLNEHIRAAREAGYKVVK